MKLRNAILGIFICILMTPVISRAQQQQVNEAGQPPAHLRLDIVIAEYAGNKKISSLPYTMYTAATEKGVPGISSLRLQVEVPVANGKNLPGWHNMPTRTFIDCRARSLNDGLYDLHISVSRTSLYSAGADDTEDAQIHTSPGAVVSRDLDTTFDVALRDGQTQEGTLATDPLTGHTLKVSVTLHVLK